MQERMEINPEWKTIWDGKWWPKIALFAWLVGKERILTWDNIQKRGLHGPSKCCLCNKENETQNHILNNCWYAEKMWNETRNLYERNRIIFIGKHIEPEETWKGILRAVKETILAEDWNEEEWKTNQEEGQILEKLNMKYEMVYPRKESRQNKQVESPDQFNYPKENFIKLNFNGASKGNPGNAGFGGIFRDSKRSIRWIYTEWGGEMKNSEAELWAVHQGLRIAARNGYRNLELEGDSQLVIEMIRKLNNGKNWEQIVSSWRTAGIVQDIGEILKSFYYLIINHIRRKGNKAADFLAN
eukprot:PITA_06223